MGLNWKEYWDIAAALEERHPRVDLLNVSKGEVLEMVLALEDFDDIPNPGETTIQTVIYSWLHQRNPEEELSFD